MTSSKNNDAAPVSIDMPKPRQEKFEILVEGLSSDLYRYAYWMCRNRVQAEELVQETFLRAWKGIDSLREADSAKAWLFTIFRREYARQFERKRLEISEVDDLGELPSAKSDIDTSTEAFVLRRALARLPEDYREPLVLQVLGGFSCEEIAATLGISSSAVMTRLFRSRKQMREMLGEDDVRRSGVSA
jgi:RNA polymerase sigma-70 factor (ECF subfamily)